MANDNLSGLDNNENDSDDNLVVPFIVALQVQAAAAAAGIRTERRFRFRMDWERHVAQLVAESNGNFLRTYRMSLSTYIRLYELLMPSLQGPETNAGVSTVSPHVMLHCFLRWLAGGSYLDIRLTAGVSVATFFRLVHKVMRAILNCHELDIKMPETRDELDAAAEKFKAMSLHGSIRGCVACVDGWLCEIRTPSRRDAPNSKSFFSGHYHCHGLNVQLACNANCQFVAVVVAAPGGTNNVAAYRRTNFKHYVDSLPPGRYVLGDNAYICTEHLLTPFSGDNRLDPALDTFNFYCSQLRVTVERSIGLLVQRWQIFKKPMVTRLTTVSAAIQCGTRLHNFIIEHQGLNNDITLLPIIENAPTRQNNELYAHTEGAVADITGNSVMRDMIVRELRESAYTRPVYNIVRNAQP